MNRLWLLFLVLSVLVGEAITCWLDQNGTAFSSYSSVYRLFHLGQILLLIVLAAMAYRSIQDAFWKSISTLVLVGLCFSFVGDVINSFLIDLSFILNPQTLLSTVPFAIAHFLYIGAFWKIGRSGSQVISTGNMVLTFVLWPLLAFALWQILVDTSAGPVLKWLSYAYAHMVVLMALTSFWPLKAVGRTAWVATAGGCIFLLSDSIFGAWLAEGQARPLWVSQAIWSTYFLAQLCIMHVPLIGNKVSRTS